MLHCTLLRHIYNQLTYMHITNENATRGTASSLGLRGYDRPARGRGRGFKKKFTDIRVLRPTAVVPPLQLTIGTDGAGWARHNGQRRAWKLEMEMETTGLQRTYSPGRCLPVCPCDHRAVIIIILSTLPGLAWAWACSAYAYDTRTTQQATRYTI